MAGPCRVGIDVGGTFTDFVLADKRSGALIHFKEPTVPADPAASVVSGLDGLLQRADVGADDVALVVHGTTLALNAVIERRGARVALVVTRGFGDILQLGRGGLPNAYNYKHPKQPPLIPRDLVFEVDARTRPDGTVTARPDAAALDALAARLREAAVDAVAVAILNAYAHPELEAAIAAALAAALPTVPVSRSAEIWPEIREFERTLVTALNAFIQPLMSRYYADLAARLAARDIAAPIHVSASNGGSVSIATARARPIETLLSGPAAGVAAAAHIAAAADRQRIITFDMGGTSSDIAISEDGAPEFTTETRVGDFPLMLPVVNVWTIGAGGGSEIWVDRQGVLKVGPASAGADPGPVCYGRGGSTPTITDCYVTAGYLDPAHFLGGRMPLDAAAARAALDSVAAVLGLTGDDRAVAAADAALRVATARMSTEIAKGMAERGLDPAEFALLAYGGAGPTHASLLADEAALRTILVPPAPGTLCAYGAVTADLRRDFARSRRLTLGVDADAMAALRQLITALDGEARAWIAGERTVIDTPEILVTADMQYPRTAFELSITIPDTVWRDGDAATVATLFHREHERLYGFRDGASPVDVTTVRVRISARTPAVAAPLLAAGAAPAPTERRAVYCRGTWLGADIYHRTTLPAGAVFAGPAVIEQEDTTVWVLPDWQAATLADGTLCLSRQ